MQKGKQVFDDLVSTLEKNAGKNNSVVITNVKAWAESWRAEWDLQTDDETLVTARVRAARKYAIRCHEKTNHQYDEMPYSFHLNMVFMYALKYIHLIAPSERETVLAAAWTHDVIEDCRETYNDVARVCGDQVADITFLLTNEKGRNRKERASDKYYAGIKQSALASFVKICDRLANVSHSKETQGSMLHKYRQENPEFTNALYHEHFNEMFLELTGMLK